MELLQNPTFLVLLVLVLFVGPFVSRVTSTGYHLLRFFLNPVQIFAVLFFFFVFFWGYYLPSVDFRLPRINVPEILRQFPSLEGLLQDESSPLNRPPKLPPSFEGEASTNSPMPPGEDPEEDPQQAERWREMAAMLSRAARGKGNFTLGSATRIEADQMGRAWVGRNYKVASDGKTLVSRDGLRQYRPPTYKPRLGRVQANFERRVAHWDPKKTIKQWQSNGHLNIID